MKPCPRRWLWAAAFGLLMLVVLPVVVILPWRWIDPPTSSFISRARAEGLEIRQEWVEWEDLSPYLPIAVVAAEDQNFPQHHGFDFKSIQAALTDGGERQRGASTLSQQVVKNLFLWSGHSWVRKGIEAYLTGFLEALWPKRRILEIYLNVAEFGPGVFGAEAAAREFFDKSASELTRRQAAALAAVLPSPKRYSALQPSSYVEERVTWILRQMKQLGGPSFLDGI